LYPIVFYGFYIFNFLGVHPADETGGGGGLSCPGQREDKDQQAPHRQEDYHGFNSTSEEYSLFFSYTATAIPIIYSFPGNSSASAPIFTFMCL
jgi:hypothetical protein